MKTNEPTGSAPPQPTIDPETGVEKCPADRETKRQLKQFQRLPTLAVAAETMNRPFNPFRSHCAAALIIVLLALTTCARAAANDALPVAVFDFDAHDDNEPDLGSKIAILISANLSANPNLILVERAELDKVLGEQELGVSGTVSPDTAAKVGQLTGAKVLVTGRVFKADGQMFIVAKIIGTETSRVYGELVTGGTDAPLANLSASLAQKIATDVTEKGDTLVAKVESHEDLVAKIKLALGDRHRPVVSVNITEQHFGQPVIDPAAQTELSLLLQQCGFTVADDQSTNRPAIAITGEAFSEFGLHLGNLQSCRARIEVKVREVATGNLIAVDRQTSVAVDIAEHIAAKNALQNGADQLAGRLLPKLVQ